MEELQWMKDIEPDPIQMGNIFESRLCEYMVLDIVPVANQTLNSKRIFMKRKLKRGGPSRITWMFEKRLRDKLREGTFKLTDEWLT